MSVTELLPLVNNLSPSDQLSLFKFLAAKIPNAELQAIFSAPEYPVWSPHDSSDAANTLMQMIQDDEESTEHV